MGKMAGIPKMERTLQEKLLEGSRSCCRVAISIPECSAVAVAGDEGVVRVYHENGKQLRRVEAHIGRVMGLVSLGGGVLLSAGIDGALRAWSLHDTRQPLDSISIPDPDSCSSLFAFEPSRVLVGTGSGHIVLYEWDIRVRTFKALGHVPNAHGKRINTVHGYGARFVTSSNDATVAVWSRDEFERQKVFQFDSRIFSAAIGERFIVAGQENCVHLYHNDPTKSFQRACTVRVPCGVVWCLKFVLRDLIVVCGDGIMNFVHTERRQLERRVRTNAINIIDLDFLNNGDVVLAGNGRDSNLIATIPRDLAVIRDDVPSQMILDPRIAPAHAPDGIQHRDPRDPRDRRRRGPEPNVTNGRYEDHKNHVDSRSDYDRRRSFGGRDERNDYERRREGEFRGHERDRNWDREREGYRRRNDFGDVRTSGYLRYDVNFAYDEDRRRNDRKVENEMEGVVNRRAKYEDSGRRDERPPSRRQHEYGRREDYPTSNGEGERNAKLNNGLSTKVKDEATEAEVHSEEAGKESSSKRENETSRDDCEESVSNRDCSSRKQESEVRETKLEPTVVGIESGGSRNNEPEGGGTERATVNDGTEETSSKRARNIAGGVENSNGQGEEISETGTVQGGNDDSAASKLSLWEGRGVSNEIVAGLEPDEIAEAMAAFMLRYRLSWKNKFESLRVCLLKYLNDNLLTADDLVGKHAIDAQELTDSITTAMKNDPNVGAKMGLLVAVNRFICTIRQ